MIGFYKFIVVSVLLTSFLSTLMAHGDHQHHAIWKACEKIKKDDNCSYTNGNGDLFIGTCQAFSDTLMCVRNKPIVKAK